jgi:hypothetical protein
MAGRMRLGVLGLLALTPSAIAEATGISGTYDAHGAQVVEATGARRPLAGRMTFTQEGSAVEVSFHIRGMTRLRPTDRLQPVDYVGSGSGKLDGVELTGRIEVHVIPVLSSTAVASAPRKPAVVIPNDFSGKLEPDGSLRIELEYKPRPGGPPDPLQVEVRGTRVDPNAPSVSSPPRHLRFVTRAENESGKLRVLSQRLVRQSAMWLLGVEGADRRDLKESAEHFDELLERLERLRDRAPEPAMVGEQLAAVRSAWSPLRSKLHLDPADQATELTTHELVELEHRAGDVLVASEALASVFAAECDPTLYAICHVSVNASGRLGMASERMTKEILFLRAEIGPEEERRRSLESDLLTFASGLATLREGLELAQNTKVLESEPDLRRIESYWERFRALVRLALDGEVTSVQLYDLLLVQAQLVNALDQFTTQVALAQVLQEQS